MASRACRRLRTRAPGNENSKPTRSAISISTSLRFEQQRASSTCSSRSTEPRNSPSSNLHDKADRPTAVRFLEALIAAVPYRLHTVLTDNGIQFADLPKNRDGWTARYRVHRFDQICRAHSIEHRLTKPNHPWTNGQVERMNRTLKEATVNCYHYDSHEQLRSHLADFVTAYNYARRLKILKGLSPYEYICNVWTKEPGRFILDPIQQMPGLNTYLHLSPCSRGSSYPRKVGIGRGRRRGC